MAWIKSDQGLGRHPKTKRLARTLGLSMPTAVGHLQYLWWWAVEFAEDGELSSFEEDLIAEEAYWTGDPKTFINALIQAGFLDLDHTDGGSYSLRIHDWDEYTGSLVDKRKKNRESQQAWRDKRRGAITVLALPAPVEEIKPEAEAETPARKVREKKGKHLLPKGWVPSVDGLLVWASEKQYDQIVSIKEETEKFLDYWSARAEMKADWDAAWRTWIRKAVEYANDRQYRHNAAANGSGAGNRQGAGGGGGSGTPANAGPDMESVRRSENALRRRVSAARGSDDA